MGDSIEQWRATIGQWSGGRLRKWVRSQHHIAQTSDQVGYKYIRFLVLVSLLVIGCVELNPGPDTETSAPTQTADALSKFHRRPEACGLQGELYGVKMAAFLFARALYRTEEFQLASNVAGVGDFDDLVFRYRLGEPDVWKTCFIQLKHKRNGGTFERSSLTKMSEKSSLLKYFKSFCEVKNKAATDRNLKPCVPFVDYELVFYTNAKIESHSFEGEESDPLSILSSGTENMKYITFVEPSDPDTLDKTSDPDTRDKTSDPDTSDKKSDKDVFGFFEELSKYHELLSELDILLKEGTAVDEDINLKIDKLQSSVSNKGIEGKLTSLKSNLKKEYVTRLKEEVSKCDFTLYQEFLSKVKIFQSQSNEGSLKGLIKKELQQACKASPSVANFIYPKFREGISKWWKRDGNVEWLNENSELWQKVQKDIINEIKVISEPEIQDIVGCGIRFTQPHVKKLSDAIKHSTVLNIVTNSSSRILQKLKTYQALNSLSYTSLLFIRINSLEIQKNEIKNLWPCKWCGVLVVDCGSDNNVAHKVLDILQQSADCDQGLDISDDNTVKHLVDILQEYQQKVILISTKQKDSSSEMKLRNISYFEDNCDISDLDIQSQKHILERTVNFQGTKVKLSTLVGTDSLEIRKDLLNSDIISILLSNKHELSVGKQMGDHCKYYVPRVLQHHVYVKEDILKLTDKEVTLGVSGLQTDELKKYLPAGENICGFVYDERNCSHNFRIVSDFSQPDLSVELKNKKPYIKAGQDKNVEEIRYITLENENPENGFRELKTLCRNVHWIHVEEGSFLWKDTNGNIDIIRRYIDYTNCEKYDDMKSVMEHKDRTMLLVAEPGMGKSTFLSYMAHEIKKWNPSVWVLRINLIEQTKLLENTEFQEKCIDKCKTFLWSAAHSPEQDALKVTKEIFLKALEQSGKVVILLDGFDEISPDYSLKVKKIISALKDKTASKIWISSRFSYRQELEDMLGKFACTLQPFTLENRDLFLKEYWSKVSGITNQESLQTFANKLLSLCSQNFSDKDGEFTGIPLQTMMLGEAFANSAKEYCSGGEFNLPENFNLLDLFQKFWEKKCDIYMSEKSKMDTSNPNVRKVKESYLKQHMASALIYLISQDELNWLEEAIKTKVMKKVKKFLKSGTAEKFGIIREIRDGKPHFVHRCFAEYFAAEWLTGHYTKCEEFISNSLFESTKEVIRNIFDRMLAKDSEIHRSVLSKDDHALKKILQKNTNINTLDKGGRTALHLAASYNSPCIQQLLSFPGIDTNKPDAVLKWTPLRYAERMKSWMSMDILLQNGADPDDIVLTRPNSESKEWGQTALWECASKGHIKLLEFMLNCGIEVNALVEVPDILHEKFTLLHRASYCGQVEVVRFIVNRGADINIRDANNNTALHLAAESGRVDIIQLLLDKGMSANLTNTNDSTPLHVSVQFCHLEATKYLVDRGAAINNTDKYGNTPLILAAHKGTLEIFRYLTEIGADINICNDDKNTALHFASSSGSVDIIKLLLDKRVSVNLTNKLKFTPLHISVRLGHMEATKTLVERGAAVNYTNEYDHTPLMVAAYNDKLEILRYLIEKGADINFRNDDNNTVIRYAAKSGNVDMIQLLLDKGMSANLTDKKGSTPLHVSAQFGHLEATKLLVQRGAAIDSINNYCNTPLMLAAYKCKLKISRYLIEKGADINIPDTNNSTVLHYAAESGSVDIIKLLLDKGMSVNLTDTNDSTPLHVSAHFGHLEATKLLVDRDADINSTNKYGRTPLMMAAYNGKLEIFRYLTEKYADINIRDANNSTALHIASFSGSVDIMKSLLDKGMSVNLTNVHEFTPLHISTHFDHLEATKALVERDAAINSTNKFGHTPLMVAAHKGTLEIFRYLTEIGADINVRDANKNTALHLAAVSGSVDIIKLLLDKGMSVNLTNTDDSTPLHISAQFGHLEATKSLVERGAGINITNKHGNTPLMVAVYSDKLELSHYLTEKGADINIFGAHNNY